MDFQEVLRQCRAVCTSAAVCEIHTHTARTLLEKYTSAISLGPEVGGGAGGGKR